MEYFIQVVEGQPFLVMVLFLIIVGEYIFFSHFIKSLKEDHDREMTAKDTNIEKLHNRFLLFQTKFIEILTKLNTSLELSQNNDLASQQTLRELKYKIDESTNDIKLLFEKISLKLDK